LRRKIQDKIVLGKNKNERGGQTWVLNPGKGGHIGRKGKAGLTQVYFYKEKYNTDYQNKRKTRLNGEWGGPERSVEKKSKKKNIARREGKKIHKEILRKEDPSKKDREKAGKGLEEWLGNWENRRKNTLEEKTQGRKERFILSGEKSK